MNDSLKNDIDAALELIKFKIFYIGDNFSKYSAIYPFTNENINNYFDRLNIKNKSILTVASSGDHIIESIIRNCKSVKAFDINVLTKYYIDLKMAAIKALDYNEFINFFILEKNNQDVFNNETYLKIRPFLSEKSVIFWDYLYSHYSGMVIRKSKLFFKTEESYKLLTHFVSYLNPDNYYYLKDILNNHQIYFNIEKNFNNYNLTEIYNSYNKKFDIILLSNIADYLDEIYKKDIVCRFQKYILNDLSNLLNDDGIICLAYLFWADMIKQRSIPLINRRKVINKYFNKNFEEWLIDNSTIKDCSNDHVLIYKRTKN